MTLPLVVTRQEWLAARLELLAAEKEVTRARDAVAARRRELPMVAVEQEYVFEGARGRVTLLEMFEHRRQLIAYHFMFGPTQQEGRRWSYDFHATMESTRGRHAGPRQRGVRGPHPRFGDPPVCSEVDRKGRRTRR